MSRNLELVFIETFDNSLTSFDCSMLKKLEFLHIDYNKLTTLNMSGNPALKDSGFVAANNHLDTLVLPNIPDFTVDAEVFYEQNPRTGYDTVEWYLDSSFTRPVSPEDQLPANGQTAYARWVPNPYTVYYRANGASFALTPTPSPAPATPSITGPPTATAWAAGTLKTAPPWKIWRARTATAPRCTSTPSGGPTPTPSTLPRAAARVPWTTSPPPTARA